MKRWSLGAPGACCALMLMQNAAFADPSCPEGTVEFISTETHERVCIAAQFLQTLDNNQAESQPGAPNTSQTEPSDVPPEYNADINSEWIEEDTFADDPGAPYVSPEDNTYPADIPDNADYMPYPEYMATPSVQNTGTDNPPSDLQNDIHSSMMNSGVLLELGIGYGFLAAANIHIASGYQFKLNDKIASFGLYLDMNIKPGQDPVFSMDLAIDPTLHISKGQFRFSLGLGFGIYIVNDRQWLLDMYNNDQDGYDNSATALFQIKPRMSFDWFLSTHSYFGAALDVPMIISSQIDSGVAPMVNIDLHIGCKF